MEREVMWTSLDNKKFEHVRLVKQKSIFLADGVIIHLSTFKSFRIRYQIECDQKWQVRKAELNFIDEQEKNLIIHSDGQGNWSNREGQIIPDLNGCGDLDIYLSPFTNTLALQRLNLGPGESKDINAAYIEIPELTCSRFPQRYTCLERTANGGLYLYENRDSDFKAELPVDSDMLLIEYPGYFKRNWGK